jgi:hypothetical protein
MLQYSTVIILLSVTIQNSRQMTFSVSTYGGYPNDNLDDTYSIQLATNAAIQNGPNNLVLFQSGQYDLNATIGIYGSINLTISGAGISDTLLLGHSPTQIFACGGGSMLTLTSFSIDYYPLAFTAGYVVNVSSTTSMDVQIVAPHSVDIGGQVQAILRYDTTLRRPAIGLQTYEIYQTPPGNQYTTTPAAGILRIPLTYQTQFVVGDPVIVRYSFTTHALYAQDVKDLNIRSITIYTSWSMGLVTTRIHRFNINDFHITPKNGRWMSTPVDCMHFSDTREYINIIDSSCEAQGDDGLNVHAFYFTVVQILNSSAIVVQELSWSDTLNVGIGTRMEFSTQSAPFTVYETAILISMQFYNSTSNLALYTFASPVIGINLGDKVCVADTPSLTIRNLTVKNNRARGVLLETRNILVTQSSFIGTSGPAILFQPSLFWHESTSAKNVTLSDNIYLNCNEGIAQELGVITLLPDPIQLIPVLSDIEIKDSTFLMGQYSQGIIQLYNGQQVTITGNYFSTTNSTTPLITICNSQNVTADNNCIVSSTNVTITQYATASPCQTYLSSEILLPASAFNATFQPTVMLSSSSTAISAILSGNSYSGCKSIGVSKANISLIILVLIIMATEIQVEK